MDHSLQEVFGFRSNQSHKWKTSTGTGEKPTVLCFYCCVLPKNLPVKSIMSAISVPIVLNRQWEKLLQSKGSLHRIFIFVQAEIAIAFSGL